MCARVVCKGRGGAAWQTEGEEGGEEGSRQGGGRAEEEETEEGEGEGAAAPIALPGARREACREERCACGEERERVR